MIWCDINLFNCRHRRCYTYILFIPSFQPRHTLFTPSSHPLYALITPKSFPRSQVGYLVRNSQIVKLAFMITFFSTGLMTKEFNDYFLDFRMLLGGWTTASLGTAAVLWSRGELRCFRVRCPVSHLLLCPHKQYFDAEKNGSLLHGWAETYRYLIHFSCTILSEIRWSYRVTRKYKFTRRRIHSRNCVCLTLCVYWIKVRSVSCVGNQLFPWLF